MKIQATALAWIVGVAGAAAGFGVAFVPVAAMLAIVQGRRLRPGPRAVLALLLTAVATVAAVAYVRSIPAPKPGNVAWLIDAGPVRLRGVVISDRDERERAVTLTLDVHEAETESTWIPVDGRIRVRLPLSLPYDYGDAVELRGKLVSPLQRTGSDYRNYLARQDVYAEMDYPGTRLLGRGRGNRWMAWLSDLRSRLWFGIARVLPEPQASLGAGIALGTRRVIEPGLNAALTSTGTAQIVVASGYNITIVSLFTIEALSWLTGRRRAAVISIAMIWAYSAFVGLYPSVVRAAIMGSIVAMAAVAGRPHSGLRALTIATAVMLCVNPQTVHDLSFLLSLSGTAGLFLLAEPLARAISQLAGSPDDAADAGRARGAFMESVATTLAATVATLPILLVAFHSLSLSALPANVLLFPLVPAIMAASVGTAVAGALWHPAALVLAPLAWALLTLMVAIVRLCAAMPGGNMRIEWFGLGAASVYYAVVGLAIFLVP